MTNATLILENPATTRSLGRSYCGRGCRSLLPEALKHFGLNRVLLVRGSRSFDQAPVQSLMNDLQNGIELVHFTGFAPDPQSEDFARALALYRQEDCDGVLAIGGGTALDLGKLTAFFVRHGHVSGFADVTPSLVAGNESIAPLIMMPTTSGSGAEVTDFAVLYQDGRKYSVSVRGGEVKPWLSLTDAALSDSMPASLTASCGLDALCQAAESLWSRHADGTSKAHARQALKLASAHLREAVVCGSPRARDAMSRAGHLAGKAINISKTTAPHALSYGLSSHYGIPHGHAVALMFGPVLALNVERGSEHAAEVLEILGFESSATCIDEMKALIASLGLESSLTALGVKTEAELDLLVAGVNQDRLSNNPAALSICDIASIYQTML